ncbi:glycoside hydrolase [candidate division KSB1 bacterium RBG_16_48_16]|nr:MAG: glycoside hydrolase [candidate division KSB1 bacterium RBG_16_48_16]
MKESAFLKSAAIALFGLFTIIGLLLFPENSGVCGEGHLKLNDQDYFETRGFNVLVFENQYNGMFFDEKTAGIMLIHHGVRTATGGAVRLKPTPEQWDQIPAVVERNVNKENNSIDVLLRYKDFDFDSRVHVRPQGDGVLFTVTLDKPLPQKLEGRTGFNLEFLPSAYFEKTYIMDGRIGLFPLYPSGPMEVKPASTQIRQFAGHSTFDDRGRSEYIEPKPIATGQTLILAPEDPERRIRIQCLDGKLMLLDGRNVAQNGWYAVRTLIPANKTGKVVEWLLTPNTIPNWTRPPMIAHSQVGYHPDQGKTAVIELDKNDTPLTYASVLRLNDQGEWIEKYTGDVKEWGNFLRYHYVTFDFSAVRDSGLYVIQYGDQKTEPFPIGKQVYDNTWQQTLDVWFPVQMDHIFVNEAYRVWHGAAHLDDARQAPTNHQHFDGFRMGDSTDTQYKPGEHIPGLNIGGWFDAGDYDIRTGSHCNTVLHFVDSWEHFGLQRDETLVDREQRYVDVHHPDGKPDLLQQIEQGTLALIAQHRAFGRAIQDIIVPNLHQYHHLGDGSTMTDNLIYNPNLKMYESDGFSSGTPDDRWAFTNRSAWTNYSSIAALAAASRALRGYNDALADECLEAAKKAWVEEHEQPVQGGPQGFRSGGSEIQAALQLYICTKQGEFASRFEELLWPGMERAMIWNMRNAIRAVPFMDQAFREKLIPFVEKFKAANEEVLTQNPFGVQISTRGWAGNGGIIAWAVTNYLLHKSFPEIIGPEYTYRGLDYIYGCHPSSNISFVSGVGVRSKKVAYGNNRADFTFIAGGVVPGVLVLKPDFPENKEDWPFLWGENEYVIDICAEYIFLANAVQELGKKEK